MRLGFFDRVLSRFIKDNPNILIFGVMMLIIIKI